MTNYEMDKLEREKEKKNMEEFGYKEPPRFATDEEAGFVDDQKDKQPLHDYSGNDQKNIEEIQERVRMSLKQKEQWREYVSSKLDSRPPLEKEEITSPNHYSERKSEPLDYIIANDLDFLEGNIVKYITRYTYKGGVNDLLKARTYLEKLIERERDGR